MRTNRSALRRSQRLPVLLGHRLPAVTADVSRGGFQAELPQVFLPGSRVEGCFLIGGSEASFSGTVVWARPGNPRLSLFSRIGVAFDVPPPGLRALFARHDAQQRRLRRQ